MKITLSQKKSFLLGMISNFIIHPALLFFGLYIFDIANVDKILRDIALMSAIGLLHNLFFIRNIEYYYQVQYLQISTFFLLAVMYFYGSLKLMLLNSISANFWVVAGTLASLLLIIRNLQSEPAKWEVTRQKGKLRKYLDEEKWVYKFEIPNTVDNVFFDIKEKNRQAKLFSRIEKLHYLMPAIGMALSRNFPDQRVALITIVFLFMGLLSASQVKIPLYKKFREWEKEKGKPLLLHDSWTNTTINHNKY